MTKEDVKRVSNYLKQHDKDKIVKIRFFLKTKIGVGNYYTMVCSGPILGRTRRVNEAMELIDVCLKIQ